MIIKQCDPRDDNGDMLPLLAENLYSGNFSAGNISEAIHLFPIIDDFGDHQDIRMKTEIMVEGYRFTDGDPDEREHSFRSDEGFSFRFSLARTPDPVLLPCAIRCTIFFTETVDGVTKKRQDSTRVHFQ